MLRTFLTDEMWCKIQPMLPPERGRKWRPSKDNRVILDGILWKHRTGAPWRDMPREYGPWNTIYTRFYRWSRSGLFSDILANLNQEADREWLMIDSTGIRAHQCAAGAKGGSSIRRWDAHVQGLPARSIS